MEIPEQFTYTNWYAKITDFGHELKNSFVSCKKVFCGTVYFYWYFTRIQLENPTFWYGQQENKF